MQSFKDIDAIVYRIDIGCCDTSINQSAGGDRVNCPLSEEAVWLQCARCADRRVCIAVHKHIQTVIDFSESTLDILTWHHPNPRALSMLRGSDFEGLNRPWMPGGPFD